MYYRGCWHIVSRGFLIRYRHDCIISYTVVSSLITDLYNPKAFIDHAALLHQTFVHCGKFPTAASRRSPGRVSVPMWPFTLSGRLRIIALVGYYPTNQLIRRILIHQWRLTAPFNVLCYHHTYYAVLAIVSNCYPPLVGRLNTCYSPVRH